MFVNSSLYSSLCYLMVLTLYEKDMRGQFFFMVMVATVIVGLHALFVFVATKLKWFDGKLPEPFKFPHLEIKLFIALSIGMLDVAFGVLVQHKTAPGWKVYIT